MRPFDSLTRLGKIRRLRQVAFTALEDYDIQVQSLKFFIIHTNTLFQVRSDTGTRILLRIYSDEETTLRENQAEMFWLDALKREHDIKAVEPIARRDGDYITNVTVPNVPPHRRCALFKWIPGRPLEQHLTPGNYHKLGQVMAKLHNHAASLNPLPKHIQPKKWDKVFYYPEEPVIYNSPQYSHLFPPSRIDLINKTIAITDELFAQLFASDEEQILIHSDLHYWNVHYHRGQLYLLDFEDISLGFPVQDVAVTLYYGRHSHQEQYNDLRTAFEQGYKSIRPWPVGDEKTMATLMAARDLNFINYVARVNPSPEAYVEQLFETLAHFIDSYN